MKRSCFKGCFCSKEIKGCHPEFISGSTPCLKVQKAEEMLKQVQHDNRRGGFTLIELLVVVLIIGILAAVALPQYQVAVTKSRYATLKHLVQSIVDAEEVYYLANGEYISDFEALDINMPGGKLDNSDSNAYFYDWGNCMLSGSSGLVYCVNTSINMYYQINFQHKDSEPRNRYCGIIGKASTVQTKVCQQETGQSAPFYEEESSYSIWLYP